MTHKTLQPVPYAGLSSTLSSPRRMIGFCAAAFVLFGASSVAAQSADAPPGLAGDSANRIYDAKYRTEIVKITMAPGEKLEYVLDTERGDPLLYSWHVDKGDLYSDFHGAPENKEDYPDKYWIRYEESEDAGAHGAVVPPFSGHTAWYWVNNNDHPVNITLELVGYFSDNKIEFRKLPE